MDFDRPAEHEQYLRRISQLSFVMAVLLAAVLTLYLTIQKKQPPGPTNASARRPVVVTPQSFTDFFGPVTAIRPDGLSVTMKIVRPGGTEQRAYDVRVAPATSLSLLADQPTGPVLTPASLADFAVGDTVQVFSAENLYSLTTFTATKIYKFIP